MSAASTAPGISLGALQEALQDPENAFGDVELRSGRIHTNPQGLPHLLSGNFASVCRVTTARGDLAVRIFHNPSVACAEQYAALDKYLPSQIRRLRYRGELDADAEDLLVSCEYREEGIWVDGYWYSLLIMPWITGDTLGTAVSKAVEANDTVRLTALADSWSGIGNRLEELGVAHGDLQHDNILVCTGADGRVQYRLLDYDSVFVPGTSGDDLREAGLPGYKHPKRTVNHYGPRIHRFSWLLIYGSLRALAVDPCLRSRHQHSDCLLYTVEDLIAPDQSTLFQELLAWDCAPTATAGQAIPKPLPAPQPQSAQSTSVWKRIVRVSGMVLAALILSGYLMASLVTLSSSPSVGALLLAVLAITGVAGFVWTRYRRRTAQALLLPPGAIAISQVPASAAGSAPKVDDVAALEARKRVASITRRLRDWCYLDPDQSEHTPDA